MASISLRGITKRFSDGGPEALSTVDLDIEDGEFVVLVGPSGCGKTTLLRIVAGLETATEGHMLIDGKDISKVRPGDRDIAMVFQNYALFPHLTVEENIGFGLRIRRTPKVNRRERVRETAALLGLESYLDRRPGELSGGQRQRVAMGRAIVRHPVAFLMDEPLSNLDAKLRVEMRAEISRLQRTLASTTIYVTHDQTEAMTMGDLVVVLDKGVVQQVAKPSELYQHPANSFVARFIGAPMMNLLRGSWVDGQLQVGGSRVEEFRCILERDDGDVGDVRDLLVGIRPEHVHTVPAENGQAVVNGRVALVEHLGKEAQVHLDVDKGSVASETGILVATVDPADAPEEGTMIGIGFDHDKAHFFDTASGKSIRTQPLG